MKILRWFQLTAIVLTAVTRLAGAAEIQDSVVAPHTCHCEHLAGNVQMLSAASGAHHDIPNLCTWCNGTGRCYGCHGTGVWYGKQCHLCLGNGLCHVCGGSGRY